MEIKTSNIRIVLTDYLEALYRGGSEEEQNRTKQALRDLDNISEKRV